MTGKTSNAGISGDESYSFTYTGNPQYLGTGWDQQYRGFGQTRETDAAGNYIVHYFYTTGTVGGIDTEKLTGKEYKTQWYNIQNNLLQENYSTWTWNPVSTGSTIYYVRLTQTDQIISGKTARSRYAYDAFGNIITEYHDGDISTTSDDSTIWRAFCPNISSNILSKLSRERVYSTIVSSDEISPNLKNETVYYYDDHNSWQYPPLTTFPIKGNLTRLEKKNDASSSASNIYTYDSYGNKLSETDSNGNTTSWTYDAIYHTYPVTKTYPLSGLFESSTYDPGTNNLLTQTDVNEQTTIYTYDTFKRLLSIDKPLGQNPDIIYEYNNWGTINKQNIKTITWIDDNEITWQSDFF